MKKNELVNAIAVSSSLPNRESELALDAFTESIRKALKDGDAVNLVGFGSFRVKVRPKRKCVSPSTGSIIEVPEKQVVAFKPSDKLL